MIIPEDDQSPPPAADRRRVNRMWTAQSVFLLAGLCCCGCTDQDAGQTAGLVTDMHEDFEHEHNHHHGAHDDHEHEHKDGFTGSHSHEHTHGHRHDKPLYGGVLVSIGHTHHKGGAKHFHAEIMPLKGDTIRLHVLTDGADGGLQDCPVESKELTALISVPGNESLSKQISLMAVGDGPAAAEFQLTIPEEIAGSDSYSVVVPKIELDGQRQNFSFRARRASSKAEQNEAERTAASEETAAANE